MKISPSRVVNIGSELIKIIQTHKVNYSRVDHDAWERFLETTEVRDTLEIHHYVCGFSQSNVPWKWSWEDGALTIELSEVSQGQLSKTAVSLPNLKGTWWKPLDDIAIRTDENTVKITAKCDHIPLLIRGGPDVDPHSKFFLGMLAIYSKSVPFFLSWMSEAADAGEPNAQQFLGRFLMAEHPCEAVYWLARSVLEHNDNKSLVALCSLLWNSDDSIRNILLAENLLVNSCNEGDTDAIFELGCLYLKTSSSKRKLAISLLSEAAARGVTEAQEIIDGITDAPPSWTDALIATGIGAAAALGVAYLVRRLRRK